MTLIAYSITKENLFGLPESGQEKVYVYLAADVDRVVVELRDKVIETESLLTVPGHYICDTCNFMQISSILHVQGGGISPDHTIPICPNDKQTMRSLTWKESAMCSQESIERYMVEISKREGELDTLQADLARVTAELEKAKEYISGKYGLGIPYPISGEITPTQRELKGDK